METKILQSEQLLVKDKKAAKLCGMGRTKWRELQKQGKIPPSLKIGRGCFWRVEDIKLWVEWGCPELDDFLELKKNQKIY
jgi:predicted DNA-binding transcriptional regulator AlpA